jgi:hypothetical protein
LTYSDTSALLTQWKRTPELAFLADVSSVPLQQTLRHLEAAFVCLLETWLRLSTIQVEAANQVFCRIHEVGVSLAQRRDRARQDGQAA